MLLLGWSVVYQHSQYFFPWFLFVAPHGKLILFIGAAQVPNSVVLRYMFPYSIVQYLLQYIFSSSFFIPMRCRTFFRTPYCVTENLSLLHCAAAHFSLLHCAATHLFLLHYALVHLSLLHCAAAHLFLLHYALVHLSYSIFL
jgi:hypothetical protein